MFGDISGSSIYDGEYSGDPADYIDIFDDDVAAELKAWICKVVDARMQELMPSPVSESGVDYKNAAGAKRVGMYVSDSDEGIVYLADSNNNVVTISEEDIKEWHSADSRTLLWSNSDITTGFAEQDITLPSGTSSKYNRLRIDFVSTAWNPWIYAVNDVCVGTTCTTINALTSSARLYNIWRECVYQNDDILHVGPGYNQSVNATQFTSTEQATIMIPWHIWGLA